MPSLQVLTRHDMSEFPPDAPPPAALEGEATRAKGRKRRKPTISGDSLTRLFETFAYQYGTDVAWDTVRKMAIRISHLRHTFGNDAVKVWMGSEKRRVVFEEQVVFDPAGKCGAECVNLFGGIVMQPRQGDVQPILDLLLHLVNEEVEVYEWILDWIAYQLQNLGAKLPTAIIMHGDEGSGKNLFWEIVRDIFGEYAAVVGQDQLESQFNDWISRKLFVIGDEVISKVEMRHLKGKLKAMISGNEIQINTKMLPLRREANHINLVLLSNELQPAALDASDRRYLVVWTPKKRDMTFYRGIGGCLAAGGREAFFHWLLRRDISQFDPNAPPPTTLAKDNLIDLGRPSPERFWLEWSGDELGLPKVACSSDQAYRAYRRWCTNDGERFPRSKSVFVREVARIAAERLLLQRMHVTRGTASTSVTRMWLFTPPPVGVHQGDWARDAITAFEGTLSSWARDFSGEQS